MIYPSYEEFLIDRITYPNIPIYKKINEDFFTPIGVFQKLQHLNPTFLLESAGEHQENGRYSYIGIDSVNITDKFNSVLELEEYIKNFSHPNDSHLPPFYNGFIGYLAYESVGEFHNINLKNKSDIDTFQILFSKVIVAIDHHINEVTVIYNSSDIDDYKEGSETVNKIVDLIRSSDLKVAKVKENLKPVHIKSNLTKPEYLSIVDKAKQYIKEGEIFQVVLSQKFTAKCSVDPFELYKSVRRENPSPYLSFIKFDNMTTICSSPELLVKNNNSVIETAPIAGTRPVKNDGKDNKRAEELLNDPKELAEHLMLVDLGRNDIGKVAKPGSVVVDSFCKVKKYSRVMHLVSNVKGELKDSLPTLSPLVSTFPAGTVSGSPKIRAMEIISELEPSNRNLYAGSIFYINSNGNFNSCIAIRTITIKDDELTLQSGGGIVYDSNPEDEYLETLNKARALFTAIEKTYKGEINYDFDYR